MKKLLLVLLVVVMGIMLGGCTTYTCKKCGDNTTKAYYDMSGSIESVLCEDCARTYWMPFSHENYRVK